MPKTILLIGTLDTKGTEYAYVRDLIERRGHQVLMMDAGVFGGPSTPGLVPDVDAAQVAEAGGGSLEALRARGDRNEALTAMMQGCVALARELFAAGRFDGALGLGGSGGTALATAVMRELPIGVPKVMVSTLASGDVGAYVGAADIAMLHSVVDIAGLNRVSRRVLANAVGAVCGMAEQAAAPQAGELQTDDRPLIAATMFGVTTPCVTRMCERLEAAGYEMLVFHATGNGGRAMEALIASGLIAAVADVTTTEWADEFVGGLFSAGPHRLEAAGRAGVPQVVSCGALDMVNFRAPETVPARFQGRHFHAHNANVTLLRTTPEECAELGRILAEKLNAATGPTALLLPLRGVSAMDKDGAPFYDPDADAALFDALRRHVRRPPVELIELDLHINDPAFADALADRLLAMLDGQGGKKKTGKNRRTKKMPFIPRSESLRRLRAQTTAGRPILGVGAGTGISAKFAEQGGADLMIIYNSGRYRMAGRGSMAGVLAYGDANAIVVDMAREVLPVVQNTPVLAGVNGTDPFRLMPVFLRELKAMGFDGVQNFPTVGLFDGRIRAYCEETGFGYGLEVDMIREAHALDMLTCPYVFDEDEARAMVEVGADVLVPHMGTTTKGAIGAQTAMTLDEAARRVQAIRDAAVQVRPDILVLCHGGPLAEPEDAQYLFAHTEGIAGFFGASSIERLAVELAIEAQTRRFKELSPGKTG